MAKLEDQTGQEKVTLEHVNVAPARQAVVGLVNPPRGKDVS